MTGRTRAFALAASALGGVLAVSMLASPAVWAQQPNTTFDGVYPTTATADPQNAVQCSVPAGPVTIVVRNGQFPGPEHTPVTIGPNGVGEASGKMLMGRTVSLPYKVVYRFSGNSVDTDLTVTRLSSGFCIYHRHGTKR